MLRAKRRYKLIVRLKAIKYKEDILCYLSSYTSPIFIAQYLVSLVVYLLSTRHRFVEPSSCPNNSDVPTVQMSDMFAHRVVWASSSWSLSHRVIESSEDCVDGYLVVSYIGWKVNAKTSPIKECVLISLDVN